MCEDYRAGASIDLEHDASDAGILIGCATLILSGRKSPTTSALFDVPVVWQNEAVNMEFKAIECGHFLAEENPHETLSALNAFFKSLFLRTHPSNAQRGLPRFIPPQLSQLVAKGSVGT
jgi:haloacetate dehalogenase